MLLTPPPPVTNCHTFSDPLPLERDVLYGRPLRGCNELTTFLMTVDNTDILIHTHHCQMAGVRNCS